jgi:Uma2 family endonuclease
MAGVRAVDSRVSFADLCRWPDDGLRYELYDGEVVVVASPLPRHQRVAFQVGEILRQYERATGGIMFAVPIDIVLTEYDVVQPDLVFFRRERRHLLNMMEATRVAPDVAVEVLSPSTEQRARGQKMDLLAQSGVPEYWIVDPVANLLEVYVLNDGGYQQSGVFAVHDRVVSPTFPELVFDAERIFAE